MKLHIKIRPSLNSNRLFTLVGNNGGHWDWHVMDNSSIARHNFDIKTYSDYLRSINCEHSADKLIRIFLSWELK